MLSVWARVQMCSMLELRARMLLVMAGLLGNGCGDSGPDQGVLRDAGGDAAVTRDAGMDAADGDLDDDFPEEEPMALCPTSSGGSLSPPVDADAGPNECPEGYKCTWLSDGTRCMTYVPREVDCIRAGGELVHPDGGTRYSEGMCNEETHVEIGAVVFHKPQPYAAACCKPLELYCSAQEAHYEDTEPCEKTLIEFHWNGSKCERYQGCKCTGEDCGGDFWNQSECELVYRVCMKR